MAPSIPLATPQATAENRALRWFRRVTWIGIAANLIVAAVSLVAPDRVLALLALEPATPLIWPRFAVFLLILLTGFYVPGAIDPVRNAYAAIGSVLCRFAGVGFFLVVALTSGWGYFLFGLFDAVFGVPQAVLLLLGRQRQRPAGT